MAHTTVFSLFSVWLEPIPQSSRIYEGKGLGGG